MPASCDNTGQARVLIVLLNWNGHQKTTACIRALREQDFHDYRILVIDNGSTDGSIAALAAIDGIDLIEHKDNLGFTGGCNRGLREAARYGAEFVWLLNNDAEAAPDCLSRMVAAAERHPRAALLSPMLYHSADRDRIQHAGSRYRMRPPGIDEAPDPQTAQRWQAEDPRRVVLWGTALLVRTALLPQIGVLDDRLFAYSEDTEYSIRCGESGFEKLTVADARVWHDWVTGPRAPYYYYYTVRNDLLMWRRHASLANYLRVVSWNYRRTARVLAQLQDRPEHRRACLLGFWDGLRQRGGLYQPDRRIPAAIQAVFRRTPAA